MSSAALALLVLAGAAIYFMNPDERLRLARLVMAHAKRVMHEAISAPSADEPFEEMLHSRTGRPFVTLVLVALNALIFVRMLFGSGAFGDAQTLIDWGGNYALRTTNGEWWRLLTAMFVHGGLFHLLATMAALVTVGPLMERAVGRIPFAGMYLAAGLLGGVVSLWTTSPTSVSYGASGALFGIYGLLLASLASCIANPPAVPVPLETVKRVAAGAVLFFLYNLATDHLGTTSELAGLGAGFAGGLVVAWGVGAEKPGLRRAAVVMAATATIVVAASVPLRGIADFRPEVERIAAVEEQTAGAYDKAVVKFRLGRVPAKELVQLIDRTIIPELRVVRERASALRGVPAEQAPLVSAAEEYFQLREASWRRRSEGLVKSNGNVLKDAEKTERAALEAFRKMKPST